MHNKYVGFRKNKIRNNTTFFCRGVMMQRKTKEKKKEKVKFQHTLTDNMQTNNDLFIFFQGF